jgi:phage terminase large subunit GpA-like protein
VTVQPFASAQSIVTAVAVEVFTPRIPVSPSIWAKDNLIVPDGSRKLGRWDALLTPYIGEPLDMTGTQSVENEFCVMKSAQTGFTTMLLAGIGHTIDCDPADMMIVQPTDGALSDFNSKKLQPSIDLTKAVARRVQKQTSRSGTGSTIYEKTFRPLHSDLGARLELG